MGEVIYQDFNDDVSGYVINGRAIEGVYFKDLSAVRVDGDAVIIGTKDDQIVSGVELSIDELNEFCFMWLAIFNQEVLVFDEDEMP